MSDLDTIAPPDRAFARRLGDNLRAARRGAGVSLQELEVNTGREFGASVVGAYERGERAISAARLARLCDILGVDPAAVWARSATTVEVAVTVNVIATPEALARLVDAITTAAGPAVTLGHVGVCEVMEFVDDTDALTSTVDATA